MKVTPWQEKEARCVSVELERGLGAEKASVCERVPDGGWGATREAFSFPDTQGSKVSGHWAIGGPEHLHATHSFVPRNPVNILKVDDLALKVKVRD